MVAREANICEVNKYDVTDTDAVSKPKSSPHPHGDFDSQQEYKVRNILDENQDRYLIDWEDDSLTGEKYEPTWEPKEYANAQAVSDWKRQKAKKNSEHRRSYCIPC